MWVADQHQLQNLRLSSLQTFTSCLQNQLGEMQDELRVHAHSEVEARRTACAPSERARAFPGASEHGFSWSSCPRFPRVVRKRRNQPQEPHQKPCSHVHQKACSCTVFWVAASSWYSSSILTDQRADLSDDSHPIQSTAALAASIE